MSDFSSSLYLGMDHSIYTLRPWSQLTTGKPGLLHKPVQQRFVEHKLAELMGYEQTMLGTSTLHLFWDVFGMLSRLPVAIYFDEHVYPIARWGIERLSCQGITIRQYPHHDTDKLNQQISIDCAHGLRPVVVADGFCPGCSQFAPIAKLLRVIRKYDGYLLIDDTQTLGIFGHHASSENAYGWGGGGSLQWHQIWDKHVISISSLAKGFGVPVAVLSGSHEFINNFMAASETIVHTSPPSFAVIEAARHAMQINQNYGDEIRNRLIKLIVYFKRYLTYAGLSCLPGYFPLQTLTDISRISSQKLYQQLLQAGIQTVLHRTRCTCKASNSFIITARHNFSSIKTAILILAEIIRTNEPTDFLELRDEYLSNGLRVF